MGNTDSRGCCVEQKLAWNWAVPVEVHDYPGERGPRWRLDDHHLVPLVLVLCGAPIGGTFMHTTDKLWHNASNQSFLIFPRSYDLLKSLGIRKPALHVHTENKNRERKAAKYLERKNILSAEENIWSERFGEKPQICSPCKSSYRRADHLRIHMRTHSGKSPMFANSVAVFCLTSPSWSKYLPNIFFRQMDIWRGFLLAMFNWSSRYSSHPVVFLIELLLVLL